MVVRPGHGEGDRLSHLKLHLASGHLQAHCAREDLLDLDALEGLPLARRTVAKYREELRIPPSTLRKTAH